jgi:hypothetical protein
LSRVARRPGERVEDVRDLQQACVLAEVAQGEHEVERCGDARDGAEGRFETVASVRPLPARGVRDASLELRARDGLRRSGALHLGGLRTSARGEDPRRDEERRDHEARARDDRRDPNATSPPATHAAQKSHDVTISSAGEVSSST